MASGAVPLYDSLGENAVEYTINHSKTSVCFVHENKVKFVLKALPKLKTLKAVVVWGNPSKDVIQDLSKQVRLMAHSACKTVVQRNAPHIPFIYSIYSIQSPCKGHLCTAAWIQLYYILCYMHQPQGCTALKNPWRASALL